LKPSLETSNGRATLPEVRSNLLGFVYLDINEPLVLTPEKAFELATKLIEQAKLAKAAKLRLPP
jgi:inactivated superfamily I helicase